MGQLGSTHQYPSQFHHRCLVHCLNAILQVGAYGLIDKETGDFIVEGNVYDEEFQKELDKHNAGIKMSDYPPQEGPVEENFIICTRGTKCEEKEKEKEGYV